MTPETLIKTIVDFYKSSKRSGLLPSNIKRGKQPSISGKAEDLFALFLQTNYSNKWNYWLEYHISVKGEKIVVPDITVSQGSQIISVIDLKMDIGFSRNEFYDFCVKRNDWVKYIRLKNVELGYRDEKIPVTIVEDLKYNIVIFSRENINSEKFDVILEKVKELDGIEVYYLTSGAHPNSKLSYEIIDEKLELNMSAFESLKVYFTDLYKKYAHASLTKKESEKLTEHSHNNSFTVNSFEENDIDISNHYENRMDKIFGLGWSHRTLRTLFDPFSSEYNGTTMTEKLNILKRIVESGEDLDSLLNEYMLRYYEIGRNDISKSAVNGLVNLLGKSLELNVDVIK